MHRSLYALVLLVGTCAADRWSPELSGPALQREGASRWSLPNRGPLDGRRRSWRTSRGGAGALEEQEAADEAEAAEAVLAGADADSAAAEPAAEPVPDDGAGALSVAQPHAMSAEEALAYYGSSTEDGLSSEEASARLERYGRNVLEAAPRASLLQLVQEQFEDRLVQILLFVAAFSGVMSLIEAEERAWLEPSVILLILVLNAFIGIWQELSAADSLEALKKLQPSTASVLRSGESVDDVDAAELVPGDVISLVVGDKIPADARILQIHSSSFSVDEGSLTGESATVRKQVEGVDARVPIQGKHCMVFSGTMVTSGRATALVTNTGMGTEIGHIQTGVAQAKEAAEKTPLGQKLDEFGDQLSVIIGGVCAAVWLISIPKFDAPAFGSRWRGALYHLKIAVALGVAAIPEGLPAVITLCLSLGTRRMARRNVIVRKLPSVETLGCTSVICTDKTGTLTTNQMTAVSLVHLNEKGDAVVEHEVPGVGYDVRGEVPGIDLSGADAERKQRGLLDLSAAMALCNDARIVLREDGAFDRVGEPTEAALKVVAEKLGYPGMGEYPDDPRRRCDFVSELLKKRYERLATLEFNRDRKSMSVLVRDAKGGNRLLVKGAPEMLLKRCTHARLPDGSTVPMTPALRATIEAQNSAMAERPLRCLAMAVKEGKALGALGKYKDPKAKGSDEVPKQLLDSSKFAEVESKLTVLGLVGIKDPARPEVRDAIGKCHEAGIRVIVITGDSKATAVAIARDIGVFGVDEDVSGAAFQGSDFFELTDEGQREKLLQGNLLFCRTEPRDKQRLVKMLGELGEVAAMTGDGVNDAPALQQSAIGVAMGITGTEVAKEAADMVLADDNFATIVAAVEEGRCIYNNMQSFICFLISCNIGEIATIFLATLLGLPEPLTPLHLLWVNLVTDGPPATALGFNPPEPNAMSRKPRGKDSPIMTPWLLTRYVLTGSYVGLATVGAFVHWYMRHGVKPLQLMRWGNCKNFEGFAVDAARLPSGLEAVAENPCAIFSGAARRRAQSVALATLVAMEMLKAASAISVDESLLTMPFWRNKWLMAGIAAPTALHLLVTYVPKLGGVFGLAPLTKSDWLSVLSFAAPVILVEELLKAQGRRLKRAEAAADEASL